MVARLDACYSLTNRLDDTRSFMAQNDGERALWILSRECICVCSCRQLVSSTSISCATQIPQAKEHTCMADSGIIYLNPNFVCPRRLDLDVFDGEVFAGFPSYCGLSQICQYNPLQFVLFLRGGQNS